MNTDKSKDKISIVDIFFMLLLACLYALAYAKGYFAK